MRLGIIEWLDINKPNFVQLFYLTHKCYEYPKQVFIFSLILTLSIRETLLIDKHWIHIFSIYSLHINMELKLCF